MYDIVFNTYLTYRLGVLVITNFLFARSASYEDDSLIHIFSPPIT